jgi:hypothetical protein
MLKTLNGPAILGNACALILGYIALATLHAVAVHAAWSHQAAHQALAGFR